MDPSGQGEPSVPKVGTCPTGSGAQDVQHLHCCGGVGAGVSGEGWMCGVLILQPASKSSPRARRQQMDLISELKRKQQKEPLIYESDRDGAIEDIITGGTVELRRPPVLCCTAFFRALLVSLSPASACFCVLFSVCVSCLSAQDSALHGPHGQADIPAPL